MAKKSGMLPKQGRRRKKKQQLLQIIVFGVVAVVVVLVGFVVIRKVAKPIGLLFAEREQVRQMQKQLADAKQEKKQLLEKKRVIASPSGAEAEARRLGYVRPGEVSIVIEETSEPAPNESVEGSR